jgi:lysophospholipase L1-like esterase
LNRNISGRAEFGLLVLSFAISFLLFELGIRAVVFMRTPAGMLFAPEIVYSYKPHAHVDGMTLNDVGCIGDDLLAEKAADEKRVILLGESTSFSEFYVNTLRAAINALGIEKRFRVTSCGKPRYTSYINRQLLKQHIDMWKPDLIVVYAGINDNIYNTFHWLDGEPSVGFLNALDFRTSVLFQFAKYHIWDKKLRSTPDFSVVRSEAIFRQNIEAIISLATERGSSVVLSTFAISYPTEDQHLLRTLRQQEPIMEHFWGTLAATARGVEAHNTVMKELADQHELPLASVSQFMPRDGQHFKDMCHLTDVGYEALVSKLMEVITPSFSRTVKPNVDANAQHQS